MRMREPLSQSFYARDALVVAPALLGKLLCRESVVLRISEVEAYCFPHDTANHCRVGRTARNAPMWGPPGHAYVYLCYGMHHLLNVVTNTDGEGAAVLIRSCEPVAGHDIIKLRRAGIEGPSALTGPGKVAAALGLTTAHSGQSLRDPSGLYLLDAPEPSSYLAGPRIGIGYASQEHQRAPWRFALAGTAWVSHRRTLVEAELGRGATKRARRSKRS